MAKHSTSKPSNSTAVEFSGLDYIGAESENSQLFLVLSGLKTEQQEHYCPEHSLILFLLEGAIRITDRKALTTTVRAQQCVFIPKNEPFKVQTIENLSALLMRFSYKTFMPTGREVWDNGLELIKRCSHPVLDIPPLMLNALVNVMQSEVLLRSANYQRIKAEEVHEIARNCYPNHQRAWFCQSIIRPKDDFRAFVEANFHKVKTCLDLAQMAGMSETPFRLLFRKTFGESAHDWMMKQKAAKMAKLVADGECDNKRLMASLNFTHGSSYIRFCQQWMGGNPSEVIQHIGRNKEPNTQ